MPTQTKILQSEQAIIRGQSQPQQPANVPKVNLVGSQDELQQTTVQPQTNRYPTAEGTAELTDAEENEARLLANKVIRGETSSVSISGAYATGRFAAIAARARFLQSQGESQTALNIKLSRKNRAAGLKAGTITPTSIRDLGLQSPEFKKLPARTKQEMIRQGIAQEYITRATPKPESTLNNFVSSGGGKNMSAAVSAVVRDDRSFIEKSTDTIKRLKGSPEEIPSTLASIGGNLAGVGINLASSTFATVANVIDFPRRSFAAAVKEEGETMSGLGNIDLFGNKAFGDLLPYEQKGTGVITNITPYTDIELSAMRFGGGIKELSRRSKAQADFEINQLVKAATAEFRAFAEINILQEQTALQDLVNNNKLSVDAANKRLNAFVDTQQKLFEKNVKDRVSPQIDLKQTELNTKITKVLKSQQLKDELALLPITALTGAGLGALGASSRIAEFGLGVFGGGALGLTAPVVTKAIGEGDLGTLGSIGVQFVGFGVGGVIGAKMFNNTFNVAETIVRNRKINVKASQSFSVSDAIKIGEDLAGNTRWRVRIEVKTRLQDAATLKTIDRIRTQVVSEVVTAKTSQEAIRVVADSVAASLRQSGTRYFQDGRVTQKFSINSAGGEGSFIIGEKSLTGTFESSVVDIGSLRYKGKASKIALELKTAVADTRAFGKLDLTKTTQELSGKLTRTRTPLKSRSLANIEVDILGTTEGFRESKSAIVKGIETTSKTTMLSDTIPLDLRVRSFIRQGKRYVARTRPFQRIVKGGGKRLQLFDRDLSANIGKSFEPKSVALRFGDAMFDAKAFDQLKPPKPSKTTTDITSTSGDLKLSQAVDFQALVKGIAESQAKTLVSSLKPKSIIRTTTTKPKSLPTQASAVLLGGLSFDKDLEKDMLGYGSLDFVGVKGRDILDSGSKSDSVGRLKTIISGKGAFDTKEAFDVSQSFNQGFKVDQVLKLNTKLSNLSGFGIPFAPFTPNINITQIIKPEKVQGKSPIIILGKKKFKRTRQDRQVYNVFIKNKKIGDNILGKTSALNYGSWVVDNTLDAQFRIKKSQGKPRKQKLNIPSNYFNLYGNKFRNYKVVGGKKRQLKNTFIEFQNRRLDTAGEVNKINAARFVAQKKKAYSNNANFNNAFNDIFGMSSRKKKRSKRKR